MIKLFYGDFLSKIIKENVRAPTATELEDRIFRKSYAQFDKEREGHISREDVGNLLQTLGVYIPENELPALLSSFDPAETGIVKFEVLYDWFKQLNAVADNAGGGAEDE
jgi:Ca2+-binding EF-hand superfamily protein